MRQSSAEIKVGDKVICNGNSEARIIAVRGDGSYDVRLWQNGRHVGDVVANREELRHVN